MFGTERALRRTKGQSPWRITLHDKRQVCTALEELEENDEEEDEDEDGNTRLPPIARRQPTTQRT